jgi:hypothetical protein
MFPKARSDDGQRLRRSEGPGARNVKKGDDDNFQPEAVSRWRCDFLRGGDDPSKFQCLKVVLPGFGEELNAKEGGEARGRRYGD